MQKIIIIVSITILLTTLILVSAFIFMHNKQGVNKEVDIQKSVDYYEKFRNKCDSDKCCLDSVSNVEMYNSEIFEGSLIKIEEVELCPKGFFPDRNKCLTSYIWCKKNN